MVLGSAAPLKWSTAATVDGRKQLVAHDAFENEFARLDLVDQTPEKIEAFKAKMQSVYERLSA